MLTREQINRLFGTLTRDEEDSPPWGYNRNKTYISTAGSFGRSHYGRWFHDDPEDDETRHTEWRILPQPDGTVRVAFGNSRKPEEELSSGDTKALDDFLRSFAKQEESD